MKLAAGAACALDGIDIGPHDEHDVEGDATGGLEALVTIPEDLVTGLARICFAEDKQLDDLPVEDQSGEQEKTSRYGKRVAVKLSTRAG
ncbi:MAG TPA: hypothetical protein VK988_10120 [Acidimicrobiales bacterium]|nr:hypothetical protein [Acidimicrobiales bacterium]